MPKKIERKLTIEKAKDFKYRIEQYTSQGFVSQILNPPITQSALSQILGLKCGCSIEREKQIEKILSVFNKAFSKISKN